MKHNKKYPHRVRILQEMGNEEKRKQKERDKISLKGAH